MGGEASVSRGVEVRLKTNSTASENDDTHTYRNSSDDDNQYYGCCCCGSSTPCKLRAHGAEVKRVRGLCLMPNIVGLHIHGILVTVTAM